MQVERQRSQDPVSGERVSTAQAICPWDGDSRGTLRVIPDGLTRAAAFARKGGVRKDLPPREEFEPYQVVGGVTAHQAYDGYPD